MCSSLLILHHQKFFRRADCGQSLLAAVAHRPHIAPQLVGACSAIISSAALCRR
nr:MAG TPA: hypothetical protein [Caudoviricetes sp.]